ncbi:hypothetical protein SAMN04488505_103665 [Chitinophaga rupis]|uniref:Uncharacterized protein n=1 Tax=Chitinophaga rupis TaxID=573321 RepID=A0A1H7WGQ1_9BACT|nr:hypothetical protein SAMN04488505_103665 [Chitinophaga rupis]
MDEYLSEPGTDFFMHSITQVMSCSAIYYSRSIFSTAFEAWYFYGIPLLLDTVIFSHAVKSTGKRSQRYEVSNSSLTHSR